MSRVRQQSRMNFLFVVTLLIVGAAAHDFGSFGPSDYGAQRGGPRRAGPPPRGGGRPFGPRRGLPGDHVLMWGKPLNPNNNSSLRLIAVYRAENVTLQNVNVTLPIKEGESVYLLPRPRGPPAKDGSKPPQPIMSYVKILFNSNSTTPLSIEYGVTQLPQSAMKFESESDEDTLQ